MFSVLFVSFAVITHLRNLYILIILGIIEDAYIVPIGINYDKILDGNFRNEEMVCKTELKMLCYT